ncbi:MAG TPA: hypothetical protein VGC36_06260 [Rhizomicrobium sp.]
MDAPDCCIATYSISQLRTPHDIAWKPRISNMKRLTFIKIGGEIATFLVRCTIMNHDGDSLPAQPPRSAEYFARACICDRLMPNRAAFSGRRCPAGEGRYSAAMSDKHV